LTSTNDTRTAWCFPALCISPVSNNKGYLLVPNKFFPIWRTEHSDTQWTTEVFFNNANYVDSHCTTSNTRFTQLTIPPVTTGYYCKVFEFNCAVNRPELTQSTYCQTQLRYHFHIVHSVHCVLIYKFFEYQNKHCSTVMRFTAN
jgi:hypothetical protein